MTARHALVLGGGGLAGIAWQTGILHGMKEAGLDVTGADLIVGTSAGAAVAAQLGTELPVSVWFQRQVDSEKQNDEFMPPGISIAALFETWMRLFTEYPDPGERRRQLGAFALAADTVPEATRRAVIAGRLHEKAWSGRKILIVAVDLSSGDRRVFDADSGVDLVDAVAASCAVPGVWPPVTIGGSRYIDGGMYSPTNADLALGHERVLVVTPRAGPELDEEFALLDATSKTEVLVPDEDSIRAFGSNPLDPTVRIPSARAGRAQGNSFAPSLAAFWTG